MANRIKGQEVEILMIINGVVQATTTDVRSFEVTAKLDKLQEGYLGETTDRYDEIFKGVDGRIELHFENVDVFNIIQSVINRARRRVPGTVINIKATLNFPNGQRARVLIADAFFGPFPLGFSDRSAYGTVGVDFSSGELRRI